MKKELNLAIKGMSSIGEIELFREMAKKFNHKEKAKCTYVKEVHKNVLSLSLQFLLKM